MLKNEERRKIALAYANSPEFATLETIGKQFGVSASTVSLCIKRCFEEKLISVQQGELIKNKAVINEKRNADLKGRRPSSRVRDSYDALLYALKN